MEKKETGADKSSRRSRCLPPKVRTFLYYLHFSRRGKEKREKRGEGRKEKEREEKRCELKGPIRRIGGGENWGLKPRTRSRSIRGLPPAELLLLFPITFPGRGKKEKEGEVRLRDRVDDGHVLSFLRAQGKEKKKRKKKGGERRRAKRHVDSNN